MKITEMLNNLKRFWKEIRYQRKVHKYKVKIVANIDISAGIVYGTFARPN